MKRITAAEFPALREFLRGYFHEDMKDEYGSAEGAARAFRADASAEDRHALAEEWERFLAQTEKLSIEEVNRVLTGTLGSSYAVTAEDVKQISSILKARK
jgi:hypothetical protein